MSFDLKDAAINPHGLTQEDLDHYRPEHQQLVLIHGRKKFGMAAAVGAANGAMNHLQEILQRHNAAKASLVPLQVLVEIFGNLFDEICEENKWEKLDISKLQSELMMASVQAGPQLVAADGQTPLTH
jgi:hypothetical protein